jgi:hypothetical protein
MSRFIVDQNAGRKKIKIERISAFKNRSVTFNKRKVGLMKKAMELAILCDCTIGVIIFTSEQLYEYTSLSNMEALFDRYEAYDGPYELLTNNDLNQLQPGKASSFKVGTKKRKYSKYSSHAQSMQQTHSMQMTDINSVGSSTQSTPTDSRNSPSMSTSHSTGISPHPYSRIESSGSHPMEHSSDNNNNASTTSRHSTYNNIDSNDLSSHQQQNAVHSSGMKSTNDNMTTGPSESSSIQSNAETNNFSTPSLSTYSNPNIVPSSNMNQPSSSTVAPNIPVNTANAPPPFMFQSSLNPYATYSFMTSPSIQTQFNTAFPQNSTPYGALQTPTYQFFSSNSTSTPTSFIAPPSAQSPGFSQMPPLHRPFSLTSIPFSSALISSSSMQNMCTTTSTISANSGTVAVRDSSPPSTSISNLSIDASTTASSSSQMPETTEVSETSVLAKRPQFKGSQSLMVEIPSKPELLPTALPPMHPNQPTSRIPPSNTIAPTVHNPGFTNNPPFSNSQQTPSAVSMMSFTPTTLPFTTFSSIPGQSPLSSPSVLFTNEVPMSATAGSDPTYLNFSPFNVPMGLMQNGISFVPFTNWSADPNNASLNVSVVQQNQYVLPNQSIINSNPPPTQTPTTSAAAS